MKPSLLPLIGARLQRPAPALPRLIRPGLRDTLDRILAHRLSCLTAPAGFGKSQALAAWAVDAEAGGVSVHWLRLAADDCQGRVFAAYLEAALDGPARDEARRHGRALINAADVPEDPRAQLAGLLARLSAQAESGGGQVLVLDDAQALLEAPQATALLLALLREAPADFHLVLAGRVPVLPPPAELQAQQQVLEIGPDVLRGKAAMLASTPGSSGAGGLATEVLDWCDAQAEGWPLALQLMLRHLQPGDDLAAARARWPAILADLESFLAQDVLALLPPRLLAALQLLALCERIDVAGAEVLTAAEDVADLLRLLARHGMLRPDPAHPGHWQPEALVACCLRERLQRERPGHAALLRRRMAEWSVGQGDWPAAIRFALSAGDAALAAHAIEQAADAALADGAFAEVLGWIEALPEDSRLARPRILTAQAWALTFLHRRSEATAVLDRLAVQRQEAEREALAISAVMQAMADDSTDALRLGQRVLSLGPRPGSLADHAAHTAVVFGLGAASHFDQVDALQQAQPGSGQLETAAALYRQTLFAFSAFQAGRLDAAGLLFEEVLARSRELGLQHSQSAAMAAAYLAAIHYERDDPELARRLLRGRRQAVADSVSPGALLHCLITEARLAVQDGAAGTAFAVLQDGLLLGRRRSHLRLQAGCLGEAIRLTLSLGQPTEAERQLRQLLSLGIQPPADRAGIGSETWDLLRMAEARVLLACNAPRRAVPLLRSLCEDLEAGSREYLAARAAVVLVRALEAAGDPEAALVPLARALRYGQRNGLVRTFADEGTALAGPMARLLLEGALPATHEVDPEYLRRLRAAVQPSPLTAAEGGAAPGSGEGGAPAPADLPQASVRLTARETDILQYMARGLSNKQIARALGLSPETVKWYLKHIYEKLQVSGRVQAIQAGLGIRMAVGPEPESDAG